MSAALRPRLLPDIGDIGQLFGQRQRIEGLARLRTEGHDMYHWTEYKLVDGSGRERTLVREPESDGIEWRLFEPSEVTPLMLDIVNRGPRIGESWLYQGANYRIDYIAKSRVASIEGSPPLGYQVDQIDFFFNSRHGDTMLVVTRDESHRLSCVKGRTLLPGVAEAAFGLDAPRSRPSIAFGPPIISQKMLGLLTFLRGAFFVAMIGLSLYAPLSHEWKPSVEFTPPPPKQSFPWQPLAATTWSDSSGRVYTLNSQRILEVRQPGPWSEGALAWFDDRWGETRLIGRGGLFPDNQAYLGERFQTLFDPVTAATVKKGNKITIREGVWIVHSTFQLVPLDRPRPAPDLNNGKQVWQGFLATRVEDLLLVVWNDKDLVAYRMTPLGDATADRLWPRRP